MKKNYRKYWGYATEKTHCAMYNDTITPKRSFVLNISALKNNSRKTFNLMFDEMYKT